MKRVWCIPKNKYMVRNLKTGHVKIFDTFNDYLRWRRKLYTNENSEWSNWVFTS